MNKKVLFALGVVVFVFLAWLIPSKNASTLYELWEFSAGQGGPTRSVDLATWLDENSDFETKDISRNLLLVKHGPREYSSLSGVGQCGACPRVGIDMYLVDTAEKTIKNILNLEEIEMVCEYDQEYAVSEDWKEITRYTGNYSGTFNGGEIAWSSVSYCFDEESSAYTQCKTGNEPPGDYQYKDASSGWCGELELR